MRDMGSTFPEVKVCSSGAITFITTKVAVLASPSQRRLPFKIIVFVGTAAQVSALKLAALPMSAVMVSMETESMVSLYLAKD